MHLFFENICPMLANHCEKIKIVIYFCGFIRLNKSSIYRTAGGRVPSGA
jgi:hypothetical protein